MTRASAIGGKKGPSVPAPRIESVEFSTADVCAAGEPRYSYPAKNPMPPTPAATTITTTTHTGVAAAIDVVKCHIA